MNTETYGNPPIAYGLNNVDRHLVGFANDLPFGRFDSYSKSQLADGFLVEFGVYRLKVSGGRVIHLSSMFGGFYTPNPERLPACSELRAIHHAHT